MTYAEKASENFKKGYNCAQAVAVAFADKMGMTEEEAAKISAPFGGGFGRLREVCGAVSGMCMVLGALKDNGNVPSHDEKLATYAETQKMVKMFEAEMGSYICRDLLGISGPENPEPTPRTDTFFKERPCPKCVECAARLIEENML